MPGQSVFQRVVGHLVDYALRQDQSDVFDSERYAVPVGWRRRRARSTPSRSVSAPRCNSTCPAHFRLRHGASCTVSVPVA